MCWIEIKNKNKHIFEIPYIIIPDGHDKVDWSEIHEPTSDQKTITSNKYLLGWNCTNRKKENKEK